MLSIEDNDLNSYVDSLLDMLYTCAKISVRGCEGRMSIDRMSLRRWERLIQDDNDSRV